MRDRDADVVVVGGGATGSVTAWQLAARGAEVVLLDGSGTEVSTGCARVFRVAHTEPTHISLALQALPLWRELEQASGSRLLTLTGGIAHGRSTDLDLLAWALDAAGKPGRWLPHDEAVERWPGIRYDDRIFFHPLAGCLHAERAVHAMRTTAAGLGVSILHHTRATAIESRGDNLADVHTTAGRYRARRVVVAAGARSAGLLADLVRLPPLRAARARSARFSSVREDLRWPVFSHHSDSGALVAAGVGTADAAVDAGFARPGPLRDAWGEAWEQRALRRYVHEWLPGADPAHIASASRTYTTTATEDFVLDRTGPLVVATGFSGRGFGLLPAIGRCVADLTLTGSRPVVGRQTA